MAYDNGRIYVDTSTNPNTGVSIGDLQQCFHAVIEGTVNGQPVRRLSGDLGVYCALKTGDTFKVDGVTWTVVSREEIKALSRYKPISDTLNGQTKTPRQLSDSDYCNRNWGFDIPTITPSSLSDWNNFVKGVVNHNYVWNTIGNNTDVDVNLGNGWVYKSLSTNGNNWFRLTDFSGYDHHADMQYTDNTLRAHSSIKVVTRKDASRYNPTFEFNISPYSPRNFKSLENYRLGIAIYSEEVASGTVYFYIDTTAITLSPIATGNMLLTLSQSIFQALLNHITTANSNITRNATFYCVGFFAPSEFSGKNNLVNNDKGQDLSYLHSVPGIGFDTFKWRYIGGTGDLDVCELVLTASAPNYIVKSNSQTTQFSVQLTSVTNNYNLTNVNPDGTIIFYPNYIYYTYDIIHSNESIDSASQTTRARFSNVTGSIDVSNTETDANGDAIPKTTNVSSYNITQSISITSSLLTEGTRIVVYLWYLTYNSVAGSSENYRKCGNVIINVSTSGELPRE